MRYFIVLIFIVNTALSATQDCSIVFLPNRPLIDSLPNLFDLPLPSSFKRKLRQHPIIELKKDFNEGQELEFHVSHYADVISPQHSHIGEMTQANFLGKVLRELFPQAKIMAPEKPGHGSKVLGPGRFYLQISDISEAVSDKSIAHLDMTIIKPANSTISSINADELRDVFGIPPSAKVVSFYLRRSFPESGGNNPSVEEFMEAVPYDVLIINPRKAENPEDYFSGAKLDYMEWRGINTFSLSQLRQKDIQAVLESGKKVLLINDTQGKLPYMHALADVSLVKGPINIFEPLAVGTSVILFNNGVVCGIYEWRAFEAMAQIAVKTGGAIRITHLDQLPSALAKAEQINQILSPSDVPLDDGLTATEHFLGHLERHLRSLMAQR